MSRIYEALQKAEAERDRATEAAPRLREDRGLDLDQDRRIQEASAFSETLGYNSSVALADPGSQVDAFDQAPPLEHVYSPLSSLSQAPGELPTRVVGLDLDALPQRAWSPAFERLPALLDRGPAVEQFRSLRSRVYELRDKRPLKTILVTSGLPQEGKSFVSTNLAVSLARNKNARVLLIDGDMRRYTVHQVLGCDPDPGLADYLASRVPLSEVIQRCDTNLSKGVTNGTGVSLPPLTVISGGNGGDKASDLSNNNRFEELIDTVSPLFDWILVDSSPVLLVARSGVTEYENAQRTLAELKSAHLLGFVLNGAPAASLSGEYYGYSAAPSTKEIA